MLYLRAVVALSLPVLVDIVVPAILLRGAGGRFELGGARFVGVPLIASGAVLLLDSVLLRFAREGRGTLAPVDPPRFVVRGGAYGRVRNPMYVANVAVLVGEGLVFESWYVLMWAAAMFAVFHTFVVLYEEPDLSARFGTAYDDYRLATGRWLPRLRR
ncbi:MAG: isoprenylcysteine carboxylmethyltransferase family protein [Acidimicrobiia bacterium]